MEQWGFDSEDSRKRVSKRAGWPTPHAGPRSSANTVLCEILMSNLASVPSTLDGVPCTVWLCSVLPCYFGTRWQEVCSHSLQARTRALVSK